MDQVPEIKAEFGHGEKSCPTGAQAPTRLPDPLRLGNVTEGLAALVSDIVPETPNEMRLRAVLDAILATIRAAGG